MIIELTHSQKVALLEAVKDGKIDTSIFDNSGEKLNTIEEIETEIVRLEFNEFGEYGLLMLSDLMRRYARREITQDEYIKQRIEISKGYGTE